MTTEAATWFPACRWLGKQILSIIISCQIQGLLRLCQLSCICQENSKMSDHAANDAQASNGGHDDDSTTSSTSAPNTPIGFYKRLAAWLAHYDQKSYLKDKVMNPSSQMQSPSKKQWTSMRFAPTRPSKTGYKTTTPRETIWLNATQQWPLSARY